MPIGDPVPMPGYMGPPQPPPPHTAVTDEPDPQPVEYTPNVDRLSKAHGDPQVWSEELIGLLGSVSGQHFDPGTLTEWLRVYAGQVQQLALRSAMFQVANTELPAHVHGDASLLMWQLRDTIAAGFRSQAGVE